EVAARHLLRRRRQALPVDGGGGLLGRLADLLGQLGRLARALEPPDRPRADRPQPSLVQLPAGAPLLPPRVPPLLSPGPPAVAHAAADRLAHRPLHFLDLLQLPGQLLALALLAHLAGLLRRLGQLLARLAAFALLHALLALAQLLGQLLDVLLVLLQL